MSDLVSPLPKLPADWENGSGLAKEIPSSLRETTKAPVDWWLEAQKVVAEMREDDIKQWRIDHGYEEYVSVMQGDFPFSPTTRAPLTTEDAIGTGYTNVYGDIAIQITDHCIMQIKRFVFGFSDFERHLHPVITCHFADPKLEIPDRYSGKVPTTGTIGRTPLPD